MTGDDSDLQPAFSIAKKLGVSRQLVYWWTRNGKLGVAGTAPDGRALYSLRQAAAVDRATKRSPLSHRTASVA